MIRRPDPTNVAVGFILGAVVMLAAFVAFRAGQRQQGYLNLRCDQGVSWSCRPTTTTSAFSGAVAHIEVR